MNLNTMMFEDVNVKNSNAQIFITFYIDDTTAFASTFTLKFLLKFENFSKIESEALIKAQTKKKSSKKKNFKEKKNFEKRIKKRAD